MPNRKIIKKTLIATGWICLVMAAASAYLDGLAIAAACFVAAIIILFFRRELTDLLVSLMNGNSRHE